MSIAEDAELKSLCVLIALALESKLLIVNLMPEHLVEAPIIKNLYSWHYKPSNYKNSYNQLASNPFKCVLLEDFYKLGLGVEVESGDYTACFQVPCGVNGDKKLKTENGCYWSNIC